MLVVKYYEDDKINKEVVVRITKAIDSSPSLKNKKDLIMKFIDIININTDLINE
jgi:type I restriction enzyme R subunit